MTDKEGVQPAPYGTFVDWDARLGREAPFFREVLGCDDVQTIIDVGAGSARHSIMFATWGIDVVAVDPSEKMQAEAEANLELFAQDMDSGGGSVRLMSGGFGDLGRLGLGPADAIICTGNALPHVSGHVALREAFDDFAAVMKPGAVLVLHLLNHFHMVDSDVRSLPTKVREDESGKRVFVRLIDHVTDREVFDMEFITLTRPPDGEWIMEAQSSEHTLMPPSFLMDELRAAGFIDVEAYGDHSGRLLDETADESVILVARKA